jgi:hypothetical protein
MPSQILHTLFGEDVITGIHSRIAGPFGIIADKALEKIRLAYRTSFALGCQGPDIFYHNRRSRPVGLEYGMLLHRRGAGIFTAGLLKMGLPDPPPHEEEIRTGRRESPERNSVSGQDGAPHPENGINALGAYALGFMTHAILDRQTHPYIIYKTTHINNKTVPSSPGRPQYAARFHAFFERILDALMLRELRGQEIESWDQEEMLVKICEKPPMGLHELLAKALVTAFPERAGNDEKLSLRIENTFNDCARFYRLTAPRFSSSKNSGISLEELTYIYPQNIHNAGEGGIDFLNKEHRPWCYPLVGGRKDNRSFGEIYSTAVETAVESISPVITAYLETGSFPITEAARIIGNGGLSITEENGRPCNPTFTEPLPLENVLIEQAKIRGLLQE